MDVLQHGTVMENNRFGSPPTAGYPRKREFKASEENARISMLSSCLKMVLMAQEAACSP
jgi:hypothetical protein